MMLLRSVKVVVELEQVTVDEDDGDDATPLILLEFVKQ